MNKFVLKPFLILSGVVVLSLVISKLAYNQVSNIRLRADSTKKDAQVLSDKLNNLRSIEVSIDSVSAYATSALPVENSALIASSQLKRLATENGLALTSLNATGGVKGATGLGHVDLSFNLDGPRQLIFDLIQKIKLSAPLSTLERFEINGIGDIASAEVSIRAYYAEPPEKLPALTEEAASLTPQEMEILIAVQSLTQPIFVNIPPSEVAQGRPDPF